MIEQVGDPTVFATNSHADTHCPYLHTYILEWARPWLGDQFDERDPFLPGLSESSKYERRVRNLRDFPLPVAEFFHRKTELFIEQIGRAGLGVDHYWVRYEWQSRGSTHAHYFLWLRGAPDMSFLNEWTRKELEKLMRSQDGGAGIDGEAYAEAQRGCLNRSRSLSQSPS